MSKIVKIISRLYHFMLPILVIVLGIQITIITVQNRKLKKELTAKWSTSPISRAIKLTPPETIKPGTKLASFSLKDTNGKEHNILTENQDKNTLLLVFSTTCSACKKNKPLWKEFVDQLDKDQWEVYGLSTSNEEKLKEFAKTNELPYPILGIKEEKELKKQLKIARVPTTIVIDKNKRVKKTWIGVLESKRDEVEKALGINK